MFVESVVIPRHNKMYYNKNNYYSLKDELLQHLTITKQIQLKFQIG